MRGPRWPVPLPGKKTGLGLGKQDVHAQESAESLFSITQPHIMGQVSSNVPHKGCKVKGRSKSRGTNAQTNRAARSGWNFPGQKTTSYEVMLSN